MTIHELIECLKLYPNQNTEIKSIHINNNNEITLRKENDGCTKNESKAKTRHATRDDR